MRRNSTLTLMLVLFSLLSFSTNTKDYKAVAIKYIKDHKNDLQLSDQDIADLVVAKQYHDDFTNFDRVIFQQSVNGLKLKNGYIGIHLKDGVVFNATTNGVFDLKKQITTTTPTVLAKNALTTAYQLVYPDLSKIVGQGRYNANDKVYVFGNENDLDNYAEARLMLVMDNQQKPYLAWEIGFGNSKATNVWNIEINAIDGSVIAKRDMVLHCDFGRGCYLQSNSSERQSFDQTSGSSTSGTSGIDQQVQAASSYRVYPYYTESPAYGSRILVSDPEDLTASPYGWHDTNGAAGAESTKTRGNNVNTYSDKDANNAVNPTSGVDNNYADGGAALNFDLPLDFSTQLDTLANSRAIQVQLFYMNNIMHDIMYKNGFTKDNANFQSNNYGGSTATDNDPVNAEAHDGSGTNNANFYASPDGTNSTFDRTRMQMYMWDGTPPSTLNYNAPASIAENDVAHGSQNGWGPCSYNVTGAVAVATSATAPSNYVCGAVNNAAQVTGKIALIDRGDCNFSEKVLNAQNAGAIGVIIINRQSAGDSLIGMAAGTSAAGVTIPAMFVTYAYGQLLKNNIATANVTMTRVSTNNCLDFDGSLDNGIVSHEYGHGISNRLTNSAGGNSCLNNAEEAGEGWSDFFALYLTRKPADTKNTERGIGNYAVGLPSTGQGIRRYPYSYDMSINPLTYADMAASPEVHDIGEIWCSAVWDMYWLFVEKDGYSSDYYAGNAGNNKALKVVLEGLKQQKCSPGFLDSRNAILKADSILYGYAHKCEIWTAFARRGMGYSAIQGSSASATDQTAAFNLPPSCSTTPTATASFTLSDTVFCVGGSTTLTSTSTANNGGTLDSIRWTITGGTPSTSTSTTVSPVFNTAGTYSISLIAYTHSGATVIPSTVVTKTVRVKAKPTVGVNSPAICSGATATLTATGATTYTWTGGLTGNPATTPVLTSNASYTVTGTTDGCTNTAVATVTVNARPTVSVNSPTICSGTTATLTATGADSYSWTGGLTGNPATTPALTSNASYTVTGTSSGCTNTAVATVTVTALPNVGVNSPTICSGTTATLTATGATSYTWTGGLTGNPATTPVLTSNASYTVTGTANGCTKTAVATVTVTTPPTVSVNSPTICSGQTATLTASGNATTYTWTGLTGNPATTPALTSNTSYTVTGTTGTCSATAVATVTVTALPTVSVNNPTICSGQTATLTANGATTYTWTGGLTGNPATTPALTSNTSYTVTGTSSGCTNTAVATVTVTPLPNVTVNSPSICAGSTATLTATGATSYSWTGGLSGNPVTTPVLNTTTSYTVTGTTGSCSKTAVATVTVNTTAPTVTITPNPASVCNGDPITLTANGADNYTWSQGGSTTNTYTFTPSGNVTVSVSGTLTGCTSAGNASVNVTVKPKPTVGVNSPSICSGTTATLTANGATTYTWTGGLSGNPATTPALTSNTSYTVTGTTDGCTGTAVAAVTVNALPTVSVNSPSICSGETATLTASGNATSYSWTGGLSGNPATTPVLTSNTSYTVTGSNGSCTGTAVANVTVNTTPAQSTISQGAGFDTIFSSTVVAGATYKWYLNGSTTPVATTSTPYYKFTTVGLYTVVVVSSSNCSSPISASFSTQPPLGVKTSDNVKVLQIYPNPTDGRLVLNIGLSKLSNVQMKIYSSEGREMYSNVIGLTKEINQELNINSYAKGIYILKLQVDDETIYQKVVRQ
ncbi:MAG: M36 family metallopeptidase [Chitinophagales bacterium]